MLIDLKDITVQPQQETPVGADSFTQDYHQVEFAGKAKEILKKHIGVISADKTLHWITFGRWSMHDLIFYCLNQTGPAHIMVATWSISELAIRNIVDRKTDGRILSASFLLDPRVKVRNPKPLQMLQQNFRHTFSACHAKVTLIWNDTWSIDIIASANLTNNPRIERGLISTDRKVFDFDYTWLYEAIN